MTDARIQQVGRDWEAAYHAAVSDGQPFPEVRAYFAMQRQHGGADYWHVIQSAFASWRPLDFEGWAQWKAACGETRTAVE